MYSAGSVLFSRCCCSPSFGRSDWDQWISLRPAFRCCCCQHKHRYRTAELFLKHPAPPVVKYEDVGLYRGLVKAYPEVRGCGAAVVVAYITPASCSVVCQALVFLNRHHCAAGQAGAAADKLSAAVAGSQADTGAPVSIKAETAAAGAAATSGAAAAVAAGPAAAAAETAAVADERKAGGSACKGRVSVCGPCSLGAGVCTLVLIAFVLLRSALNRSWLDWPPGRSCCGRLPDTLLSLHPACREAGGTGYLDFIQQQEEEALQTALQKLRQQEAETAAEGKK